MWPLQLLVVLVLSVPVVVTSTALPPRAPDCTFQAIDFDGSSSLDITNQCGGGSLSSNFSVYMHVVFDTWERDDVIFEMRKVADPTYRLWCGAWTSEMNCRWHRGGVSTPMMGDAIPKGKEIQYFFTVNQTSGASFWSDNRLLGSWSTVKPAADQYTLHLGGVANEYNMKGRIEELRLWKSEALSIDHVMWATTTTTTVTRAAPYPTCAFQGMDFDGTSSLDITSQCGGGMLSGDFSVYMRATFQRISRDTAIFDFRPVAEPSDKRVWCGTWDTQVVCKWEHERGSYNFLGEAVRPDQEVTYFLTVSGTSGASLWVDGRKLQDSARFKPEVGEYALHVGGFGTENTMTGRVSELKVWKSAFSGDEVEIWATATATTSTAGATAAGGPTSPQPLPNGLTTTLGGQPKRPTTTLGGQPPSDCLLITALFDVPGWPEGVELYARCAIPDLSEFGMGTTAYGTYAPPASSEVSLPAVRLAAGSFYYVNNRRTTLEFTPFFGFDQNATGKVGNDGRYAVLLFHKNEIIDVYGVFGIYGRYEPWEYNNGWAYRRYGGPATTFDIFAWTVKLNGFVNKKRNDDSSGEALPVKTYDVTATTPPPLRPPDECLQITAVFDSPLYHYWGPKGVELYARCTILDTGDFGMGASSASSAGQQFSLPARALAGGSYYYVSNRPGHMEFKTFFGFESDLDDGSVDVGGHESIELFYKGQVVDVFGDVGSSGKGKPWDYEDGWAYRLYGGPSATFDISHWKVEKDALVNKKVNSDSIGQAVPLKTFNITAPLPSREEVRSTTVVTTGRPTSSGEPEREVSGVTTTGRAQSTTAIAAKATAAPKTTPPAPSPPGYVEDLITDVNGTQAKSAAALRASSGPNVTMVVPGVGSLFAGRFDSLGASVTAVGMSIMFPQTLFSFAAKLRPPVPNDELIFTALPLKEDVAQNLGALGAVVLDLMWLSGTTDAPVEGLAEPVVFSLPVPYNDSITCAYWDEKANKWSQRGVRVSKTADVGGELVCETTHFSLFGAILKGFISTLLCANFQLLRGDAIKQIWTSSWAQTSGGVLALFIYVSLALLFIPAVIVDRRRRKLEWKDEFFLVPVIPEDPEPIAAAAGGGAESQIAEDVADVGEHPGTDIERPSSQQVVKERAIGTCHTICSCDAFKEALDDICSSWFEYFGEVRSFMSETCGQLRLQGVRPSKEAILIVGKHISIQLLSKTAQYSTAATLGLSYDVIDFILNDEDLADYLTEEGIRLARAGTPPHENDPRAQQKQGHWRRTNSQYTAWSMLRKEVCEALHAQTAKEKTRLEFWMSICKSFAYQTPIGTVYAVDIFQSSKQKVVLLTCDILGALTFCCVFFETTGLVTGKPIGDEELCDSDDSSSFGFRIGRFLVIATTSLLLSGVPVILLESLQTKGFKKINGQVNSEAWKKQLRTWRIQENMFWFVAAVYNTFCSIFILTFLSNINSDDHAEWTVAGMFSLIEDTLAFPLLLALAFPVATSAFVSAVSKASKTPREQLVRQACEALHKQSNMMLPREAI